MLLTIYHRRQAYKDIIAASIKAAVHSKQLTKKALFIQLLTNEGAPLFWGTLLLKYLIQGVQYALHGRRREGLQAESLSLCNNREPDALLHVHSTQAPGQ